MLLMAVRMGKYNLNYFLQEKFFYNQWPTQNTFEIFIGSKTPEFYDTKINRLIYSSQYIDINGSYFD